MKWLNLVKCISTEESEGKYIFSFNVISHLNSWQIFRRVQIQNSNLSLCKGESAKNENEILKSFLKIWFVDLIHHLPQQNKSLALHCRKSYSQQVPCDSSNPPSTGVYACEILPLDSWKPFFARCVEQSAKVWRAVSSPLDRNPPAANFDSILPKS